MTGAVLSQSMMRGAQSRVLKPVEAAELLGLSRPYLVRLMNLLDVRGPGRASAPPNPDPSTGTEIP